MNMKRAIKKRVVSTKLSSDTYEKLHAYAEDKNISLYEAVSKLLVSALHMKDNEDKTICSLLEGIKEDVKEIKEDNHTRHEELVKYLKRIYYHSYRSDVSLIEFAKRIQGSEFADELHRAADTIVQS
jgi:superfamily I DNA/RNA helicase